MKLKKIASTILMGVFSYSVNVWANSPDTLEKMIEKAVSENPEVQARFHAFKAAEFDESAAKGRYLPNLTIDQTFRNQERLTPNVNNTFTPNQQSTLTLRQMIFDGLATPSEVGRLDHVAKARFYELQAQMQNVALDTAAAYFDLLRYRRLVSYAQDNFVVHKQVFDKIKSRVDAGVGKKVDLEQATGRLALAEANLLTETTNLYDVSARFQRLVGELPSDSVVEVMMSDEGLAATPEQALELAYKQNPNVLASIENIIAVEKSVSGKKAPFMPRVDLQGRKVLDVNGASQNSTLAADTLEVTASWNIFNGFTDKSNLDSAVENLNQSHDLRDKACIDARQQVSIAYNSIKQLKEQVAYRQQHQDSIEKARLAYRKQYDIGQRTLLDLLDTENEYFQSRRNFTSAEMDMNTAYARTYAGQGLLLSKLGVTRADVGEYAREEYMDRENVCKAVAATQVVPDKAALLANAKPWDGGAFQPKTQEKATMKFTPRILFQANSAIILPESYADLDIVYDVVKEWGTDRVEIAGHTDKRNTSKEKYNLLLSEKRAKAVSDYLIKKGMDPKRLIVKGYGFSKPLEENDPVNGNDANRRVEVIRYQQVAE
ncbi:TolC family outer membrane protein [Methylophilus aquaticus]|uniref:TolC family outer membrane protein n=1 Tax=Methylophilus aquaticus TaxID=1971610 RepID=A0ABT9JRT8_9PROT|nr:TolC family outer membrane protein [Methylophilus aquaticus]MDP8567189.1 TolC family outer membrane protein [Methylophilus aquaticus]